MQTYKNYQQCTTITTDKIKYLSAGYTYFTTSLKVLTHPESKQDRLIISILIVNSSSDKSKYIHTNTAKITLIIDITAGNTIIFTSISHFSFL
jgi:hypothetical protein